MKLLVISDIHANPEALEAVLESTQGSYTGFLCLGDITGYGPDPERCIQLIQQLADRSEYGVILGGNHDAALSGAIPLEWFNATAQRSVVYTRSVISSRSLEWLNALPDSSSVSVPGLRQNVLAVHGSPLESLTGYLFGGPETAMALSFLSRIPVDVCFAGHTHQASFFTSRPGKHDRHPAPGEKLALVKGPVIVNPGSTGFPRSFNAAKKISSFFSGRRGDTEPVSMSSYPAYFALWDTDESSVTFLDARYDRGPLEKALERP